MKRGLYLVTPDWDDSTHLLAVSRAALMGGAAVLQYRHKTASAPLRLAQAIALRELTREFKACLIINDDVELGLQVGADGVHIGRDDGELASTRARAGQQLLIGVSCYNDYTRAQTAARDGADYIAFGAMYASPTKPQAVAAPISLITQAKAELRVPVACIGGITADNAAPLIDAGADWVAVISDIYQATDPQTRAQQLSARFA